VAPSSLGHMAQARKSGNAAPRPGGPGGTEGMLSLDSLREEVEQGTIDTVVFDVGWVLVHLDFAPLLTYLGTTGQCYTMPEVIAAINLEAHERGELSSARLIDNLLSLTPTLDRVRLKRCWLDMFSPVAAMFILARQLSADRSAWQRDWMRFWNRRKRTN